MTAVTGAWADSVNDLVAVGPGYTFIADNITSNGTVKLVANTLYDGSRIFAPTANSVSTGKGSSTIAGVSHLNSLRLKNTQDQLVFKVSEPCIVTFYTQSDSKRGIQVGSTVGGTQYGTQTVSTTTFECTIPEAGLVYLSSFGGDFYFAGFEVKEKPKTVYFDDTSSNWGTVKAYAWYNNGESDISVSAAWPGDDMTYNSSTGLYEWSTTGDPTKIIFNNSTEQTPNWDFVDGATYNKDGRIMTVTFKNNVGWENVKAYVWTPGDPVTNEKLGSWPGTPMTDEGEGTWTISFASAIAPEKIIFNNGKDGDDKKQSPDLDFEDGKTYEQKTYTATFTTDAGWETVKAHAWNGATNYLGEWPGTALTANDEGVYSVTINTYEDAAPAKIQFNNGKIGDDPLKEQTNDQPFVNGKAYKYITATPLYAIASTQPAVAAGTTVDVTDSDNDVVATLTYGVSGGKAFGAATDGNGSNDDYKEFQYMTQGNGENGSATGGTVYTIKPVYNGTITVGVRLNGGKNFFIQEDGTSMEGYDGITIAEATNTSYSFPVKGGSTYKIFCTGSKLGFFGFDYDYNKIKIGGSMNDWNMVPVNADSYTFKDLEAGTLYKFKVVDNGVWKGFTDLTDVAGGLDNDESDNICFTLAEAGNVTVNYKSGELFTVEGNFVLPTVALAGSMNEWSTTANVFTPADDKKTASVTVNLAKDDYEFKMVVDGNWLSREGEGGTSYVLKRGWRTVDGVDQLNKPNNMTLEADVTGDYTFTWTYATNTLTITFPTDLTLDEEDDNTATLTEWNDISANINLKRTLKANGWNTFTIPYDISKVFLNILKENYGITAVKELTDATLTDGTLNLKFKEAESIEAGKPYLVMVENDFDLSTIAVPEVVKATPHPFTSDAVDFIPTLGKTTIPAGDVKNVLFMTSGGNLKHPTTLPADIKGFRAYFQLKDDAVNAASFNLDFGNGETTGINSLTPEPSSNGEGTIYSLDGRRLSGKPAQKGVYIVNGKKMVIK